jgi:hypothetical protein
VAEWKAERLCLGNQGRDLATRPKTELPKDLFDVPFSGTPCHEESFRDLAIAEATRDQKRHLELSVCESREFIHRSIVVAI